MDFQCPLGSTSATYKQGTTDMLFVTVGVDRPLLRNHFHNGRVLMLICQPVIISSTDTALWREITMGNSRRRRTLLESEVVYSIHCLGLSVCDKCFCRSVWQAKATLFVSRLTAWELTAIRANSWLSSRLTAEANSRTESFCSEEHKVFMKCIYVFFEGFSFPCFHPDVVHIPEPVARSSSYKDYQGSVLNFFHVVVGHYWGHWWAHGTVQDKAIDKPLYYQLYPRKSSHVWIS